jgi:predicted exporter
MSGIEVAGLVLGCLPLLIQGALIGNSSDSFIPANETTIGIESYNEGLDPIKSFVRWERELPQFIRKLRNQHVHYAQTIRILFEPITSEVELADMMANPGSAELWKGKAMAKRLQERLQESYQAYQGTIVDIERITKKIASKLDLDRAAEV